MMEQSKIDRQIERFVRQYHPEHIAHMERRKIHDARPKVFQLASYAIEFRCRCWAQLDVTMKQIYAAAEVERMADGV